MLEPPAEEEEEEEEELNISNVIDDDIANYSGKRKQIPSVTQMFLFNVRSTLQCSFQTGP